MKLAFLLQLFLDAKHLPVMWLKPRPEAEKRRRLPITFLFTDVCVTLVAYRHDVKRGSSASWLFQDPR